MALSLQDLLVGLDASAPQAPRANASAPRDNQKSDPFAALFSAKVEPKPAPRAAQSTAPSSDSAKQRPAMSGNGTTAPRPEKARAAEKPTRADDDATNVADDSGTITTPNTDVPADRRADNSAPTTTDTNTHDSAADAQNGNSSVAPAIVNLFQVALLANASPALGAGGDIGAGASTDPLAATAAVGAPAPGLQTAAATIAATPAEQVPASKVSGTDAAKPSASEQTTIADLLAAVPAKPAAADSEHPFTVPASGDKPADVTTPAATVAAQTDDTPAPSTNTASTPTAIVQAGAALADAALAVVTASNDSTPDAAPAPQASAVAQVAVQASRAAGDTAAAVRTIAQAQNSAPASQAAATAQIAVQAVRPSEAPAKATASRSDAGTKSAAHDSAKPTTDAAATSAKNDTPAQPAAPAIATPVVDDAPVFNAAATPTPDQDAPPPAQDASAAATPTAAPAASPQVHQLYAQAAARTGSLPQVTVDQVVTHVVKAADDGFDRLTIQLKPEHLGAIEVKLEMHDDGGIAKATISADRADTLDLLQKDSHRLERALENAGIKTDTGSLSFNLRGDGGRHQPSFGQDNSAPSRPSYNADDSGVDIALTAYVNARVALGGVDIRV